MKSIHSHSLYLILLLQSSLCYSSSSINITLLPDLVYSVHHIGAEVTISDNSRLGFMFASKQNTNRPTFEKLNNAVSNNFNRILIPWTYSFNGVWQDSFFTTALV